MRGAVLLSEGVGAGLLGLRLGRDEGFVVGVLGSL